ncbi:MAG: hypothetical protein K2X81_16285 [Candidatus Obscuribacterales bacterium]|nr:hypothetical protein [Candidatus Obscuribacterales bacterium]
MTHSLTSKILGLLVLSLGACQFAQVAYADAPSPLSADQVQHLNKDTFEPLKTVASWPESVKEYYRSSLKSKDLSKEFADPGKPFEAGCVRTADGPPDMGFMLGAKSGALCIINYQIGGFALRDMVDIFELKDHSAQRLVSKALYPGHAADLKQLLEQLRKDPILTKTH